MSPRFGRFAGFLARLRFLLPALALTALAAFIDHPAALLPLLLAQPLYLAGIVGAFGYLLDADFAQLALRRGTTYFVLLLAYAAFVALVVGTPTIRLGADPTALNAALLSLGIALALGALWRLWPVFGLAYLWDDAYPPAGARSWIVSAIARCFAFARHLTGEREVYFGSGLPVALGMLLLVAGALSLAGLTGAVPSELRLTALWLYALVLCPLVHGLVASRTERLLLDAGREEDEALPAASAPAPELAPIVLKPADAATRNAQVLAAAASGQVELALALLAHGAEPDAQPRPHDRDQRSLAIMAATCADLRLLRALIARGVDLDRAVAGLTPLIAATRDSYQGRGEAVMTLITNGADPRRADAEGRTPLHYAALSCEATVAAVLVDAGADPNAVSREGLTPLGTACAAGNETLARFLLERGAKPEVARAQPALIAAASGPDDLPGMVKLLLRHRADAGACDLLGRNAVHAAALHNHAEMLDALLAAGAPADERDANGVTALMDAARSGANRALQRLVFRKPAPDPVDPAGRNALVIACQSRQANEETVRLLLAVGVDPATPTRDGRRAVDYAVAAGRWPLVRLLDPDYPLPETLRDADEAPGGVATPDRIALLRSALRHGRHGMAAELLRAEPRPEPAALAGLAAELACADAAPSLGWLLDRAVPAEAGDSEGVRLLDRALAQRPLPLAAIARLLGHGATVGATRLVALLDAPADEAGEREACAQLALALLERGADASARGANARSSVHAAAELGVPALLAALLARGHDPNVADARGRTPLHALAAWPDARAVPLAMALLAAGADPERPAADGQTPLGAALAAGRSGLARWLSWNGGFRHPARALRGADLAAAAAIGDNAAVERLLELGLALDARDAQGCTALLRACGGGHVELAAQLLRRGADPAVAAATGATCLSAAVSGKREAIVARLLDAGVDVDQPLPGGSTPLMVAAALGLPEIARTLLMRGASPHALDDQGTGPLHAAAQYSFGATDGERCRRLLELLLEAGCAIDARNRQGQTPLLLLLGARAQAATPAPQRALPELAQLLLARGAEVDAQDERGVSCLHAATMHGELGACAVLLRAGADRARRDRLGRDAYDVALMLGYADVAGELRRARAG